AERTADVLAVHDDLTYPGRLRPGRAGRAVEYFSEAGQRLRRPAFGFASDVLGGHGVEPEPRPDHPSEELGRGLLRSGDHVPEYVLDGPPFAQRWRRPPLIGKRFQILEERPALLVNGRPGIGAGHRAPPQRVWTILPRPLRVNNRNGLP